MESEAKIWLEHLEEAVPEQGYGNRLSMYLIALEAWRRGVSVNFYTIDNPENKVLVRYSLKGFGREYHFESSRGDKLSEEAYTICQNKDKTKKLLAEAGVDIPVGKRFTGESKDDDIIKYAESIGYPVVLKPTSENAGKGVYPNISSIEVLEDALYWVKYELGYQDIMIEKYIPGTEYRILLVQGEVIGAINRVPANIIGDGENTIETLIAKKNKSKKSNPNISKKTIKVDNEVMHSIGIAGYELESILPEGQQIYLRNKSNISTGGDPIDVTDSLTPELKDTASRAAKAIPGLDVCGLDMIVDTQNNKGTIIEINTKPMLGLHLYPVEGRARDVLTPLLDYYFPETINGNRTSLYFDFESLLAPLNNITTNQLELLPPPSLDAVYAKKYTVTGEISRVGYGGWIRRRALQQELHGFTMTTEDGEIEVVVASDNKEKVDDFKAVCLQGPDQATVENVEETVWRKPVKIGFEIRRESASNWLSSSLKKEKSINRKLKEREEELEQSNKDLQDTVDQLEKARTELDQQLVQRKKKNKKLRKELQALQEEKSEAVSRAEQYKEKYQQILNSRSWKYTSPLRQMLKKIK
ncbi:acylphosphatase [Virgibacillus xinjiangensis]|uniref:Acylphosphatase n=1 Tax=Virgibacillus xinjiangensis TaxID=393090 RepID=A0ABV7CTL7_9BACI